jgi:hypothetical protein
MQRCGSTATPSPSARIACVEHTSMHAVQPTLRERACAQIDALYAKYFGFLNSPVIVASSATAFACATTSAPGAK